MNIADSLKAAAAKASTGNAPAPKVSVASTSPLQANSSSGK